MRLPATFDAGVDIFVSRRRALLEVVAATLVIALAIFCVDRFGALWSPLANYGSAFIALAFLGVPLVIGARRGITNDVHGLSGGHLVGAIGWGLGLTLLIAGPFFFGFDVLQTKFMGRTHGSGPGMVDYPVHFGGTPRVAASRVTVFTSGAQLAVNNGLGEPVVVVPACESAQTDECARRTLVPGGQLTLSPVAAERFSVKDRDEKPLSPSLIATGELGHQVDSQPIEAPRTWLWLLWAFLTQVLVVALPEEAFFRGYVQGRLRALMPPSHRVLGVPFGAAHLLAAALFASIHLVTNPSPSRLLVFFPALLFAWLAERNNNVVGAIAHHALSNVMLQVVRRFYG